MPRRRPSPALTVAILALVVALGGTAVAASRYIITSTNQIKPSVLRELRSGIAHAAVVKLAASGAHGVIARVRSVGAVTTTTLPTYVSVPLSGATWKQGAEELDLFEGQVTVTTGTYAQCQHVPGESVYIPVFVDGNQVGSTSFQTTEIETTTTHVIGWVPRAGLYEPGNATTHTFTVEARDTCEHGGHFKIDSISIDVVGLK